MRCGVWTMAWISCGALWLGACETKIKAPQSDAGAAPQSDAGAVLQEDAAATLQNAAALCAKPGTWTDMPSPGLQGRVDHTAVWTGDEMIVWGGTQDVWHPFADGAAYNPNGGLWRTTGAGAPTARDDHAAVWTGSKMIIWGGNSFDEGTDKLDSGARYDPKLNLWHYLAKSGMTARDDPRAVWTGTKMIVWGGRDEDGQTNDGGRYDPVTDSWLSVSLLGAPEAREDHTMVWTGKEMIVWGGWNGNDEARNYNLLGRRYDPATDTWTPIATAGQPQLREDHAAIWTGTEMFVWGGVVRDGTPPKRHRLGTGGRYDPATDTWRPITLVGAPSAREDGVVVWTGDEMIVWGGRGDDDLALDAARYSPILDAWCPMASAGAPPVTHDAAGVWAGGALVIWGGDSSVGKGASYVVTGGVYVP